MASSNKGFLSSCLFSKRTLMITIAILLLFVSWRLVLVCWFVAAISNLLLPKETDVDKDVYGENGWWSYQNPHDEESTATQLMQKVRASGINTPTS